MNEMNWKEVWDRKSEKYKLIVHFKVFKRFGFNKYLIFLFSFLVTVEMNSQVDSVNDPTESQQDD